ncbi:conserved virulence factor C family protein [Indiicoccus explosivorum]|uniref:conserved virulence factor C family protein n=1 Tax=Indiicoccus explosivorum TaxID=1917864 RepID=UPI000B449FDF|nr:conserved virulence factor C family protein [Indiicoccus explosivorum]
MKITAIEPTPSPNTMKVIIDQELPFGKSHNYKPDNLDGAPEQVRALFEIDGVKGVYHVADFLAVERNAKYDWEGILAEVRRVFGEGDGSEEQVEMDEHYGEVYVHVQQFKGIPIQVKVFDSQSEERFGMPARFLEAMKAVMKEEDENYIFQRKWADYGVRYGEKAEIGENVLREIEAAYPQDRLDSLIERDQGGQQPAAPRGHKVTVEEFDVPDWKVRFQLLDQLPDPDATDLPLLAKALEDEQMSIRRLAAVYLGMIEQPEVVPYLERALQDKSAAVRRTAGDCMSDLGFQEFEDAMIEALSDRNKLVRWRAAMFLYETGTEKALPALKEASEDKEFEVKLQAKMAVARIEGGEEAKGSVWKQMTEARQAAKKE